MSGDPGSALARPGGADDPAADVLVRWLVTLRWAVFCVLALTLPIDEALFGFHVRYAIALPILALVLAVNVALQRRAPGTITKNAVALAAAFDMLAIGGLLAASGGAANPFSAVFVVYVALAASLLPARTTFALAGLAACSFGALFALPLDGACTLHHSGDAFSAHLYGMWLAFVLAAGLVSFFLTRVRSALAAREAEIHELRQRAEEAARFASLGTLAAGTAHELATPIGTIAVLASELPHVEGPRELSAQADAITAQVGRCREILTKMQAGAGDAKGGAPAQIGEAVRRAVDAWRQAHPEIEVRLDERAPASTSVPLSEEDVRAALCVLLDNALHATVRANSDDAITVGTRGTGGGVAVVVEDGGTGVDPALLDRLGEPFLTTKEPGEGMGLGLYWLRTILERIGGRLEVEPRAVRGTRMVLRFDGARA
jgi:two-component system sensor histidine kinase RegB